MVRAGYVYTALVFLTASVSLFSADKSDTPSPQRASIFRSNVEMVVIRASVTDALNRYVVGLEREHFKVFDNKVEQTIAHFSSDNAPLSVGIIFDISGSMANNLLNAKNSVVRFLQQGNREDEYFLVTFNERTMLVQDFTSESDAVRNEMPLVRAKGRTALYDAIYAGLQKLSEARNDKKALVVITDGEDNSSRYTFSDVKDFAKESDAQIYVIGEKGDLGYGRHIINEIVSLTGGRAFFPQSLKSLDYYCDLIHTELRNQYVLGYVPNNAAHDGKWRKVKVQVQPPEGLPRLSVHAKEGYFASKR
ncbi:MAG: VWA domain-containing protein [Acidobacteria bacterium]|nr:VWA domain-containing protein [Acidobacteriota bacterium]